MESMLPGQEGQAQWGEAGERGGDGDFKRLCAGHCVLLSATALLRNETEPRGLADGPHIPHSTGPELL